jgi:hypothetical protein
MQVLPQFALGLGGSLFFFFTCFPIVASKVRREGSDRNAVDVKQQLNRHADVDTDLELLVKVNTLLRDQNPVEAVVETMVQPLLPLPLSLQYAQPAGPYNGQPPVQQYYTPSGVPYSQQPPVPQFVQPAGQQFGQPLVQQYYMPAAQPVYHGQPGVAPYARQYPQYAQPAAPYAQQYPRPAARYGY